MERDEEGVKYPAGLWFVVALLEVILIAFSAWFFSLEVIQVKDLGYRYFEDPWNYVDFVPPAIISLLFVTSWCISWSIETRYSW